VARRRCPSTASVLALERNRGAVAAPTSRELELEAAKRPRRLGSIGRPAKSRQDQKEKRGSKESGQDQESSTGLGHCTFSDNEILLHADLYARPPQILSEQCAIGAQCPGDARKEELGL
jgi:hypothetical protein